MKYLKGKGFDLSCGLVVVVVVEQYSLTGTFLGEIEDRHCKDNPIDVNVNRESEFILLQLTCPLDVENVPYIPVGTIVAINVEKNFLLLPVLRVS
jgi:hypothetical protein